ncbi:Xaa-Pro aminopeptidase [Oceanospirillum linum]|uniref:Xaa-Pro aminopeptidase n=1 Tax=Oceanospirillum linum TaxID=966 RepID=A0A1T1HBU6_OCELI|nr:Xaa-Pro aminopeptidase [Oceanospirillum linum]OOV87207.1 Xaa-Pro aminopeptidase [Oceanospirillum linum]SEF77807.1 aminopeptidase P Metallo peptidase. MEROPS family M24B [Oleiphilus messinensis]SMP17851.1 aminopeptidase P Metallo peptidase. MEROPS family M24B [Oceanospirillum linum]
MTQVSNTRQKQPQAGVSLTEKALINRNIIAAKETYAIPANEYAQRRQRLMDQLPEGSVAILPGAEIRYRNNDADYAFRQNSDFYYLTGFAEEDAWLVLTPGHQDGDSHLFSLPKDRAQEVWTGFRIGQDAAKSDYGISEAYTLDQLDTRLPELLNGSKHLFYPMQGDDALSRRINDWSQQLRQKARAGKVAPEQQHNLLPLIHEMRLFKSDAELEVMRVAAEISAAAHSRAMGVCEPGMMEYQLEAEYLYHFMRAGSRAPAYNTIVGGGANACILHYVENSQPLQAGDLVLVDAGCELEHYAADITRTFPVSGRFSPEQAALYQVVLEAQYAAIDQVQVGRDCHAPHRAALNVLCQGLLDLGLLAGTLDEVIESESYRRFFMHGTSHWLGIDVHDAGRYKVDGQSRPLQAGMVLTVEPGLYIAHDDDSVEKRWQGIGIRIEDNVIVTESGPEVITSGVPKNIAEIEALMAGQGVGPTV